MNLFDNAEWLKIPELKKLDDELLNYIDYIYNEFPELHYTDDEWVNILKRQVDFNNKRIIKFINKYLFNKVNNSTNIIIMYIFIKCDLNRFNNIIKKLDIGDIYSILANLNFSIDIIFTHKNHIKNFKYLYSFLNSSHKLYYHYIQMRIFLPVYSKIIPYLLSKYSNHLLYNDSNIYLCLTDFYDKQYNKGIYTYNDINIDLYNIIIQEYMENMRVYVYNLYDHYINQFIIKPNYRLLNILLNYNIKPIDNENSLRIIKFLKQEQCEITDGLVKHIIAVCNLTTEQINELKAYHLLSNI